MTSLVDRMRKEPPTCSSIAVFGFDPDLDTTGWALVLGAIYRPAQGLAPIAHVHLGVIEHSVKGTDMEKAAAMVQAVAQWDSPTLDEEQVAVFVEAQQVYPDPDQSPQERVGKANDLLRLAQITGAVQHMGCVGKIPTVRAVLPHVWKGNVKKHVTVSVLQERMPDVSFVLHHTKKPQQTLTAAALSKLPGKMGHALDAAGIALYGLDFIALHGVTT